MKVIKKLPGESATIEDIPNTLEALQAEVEGYIEVVPIYDDLVAIVNEEGLLKGMPLNIRVRGYHLFGPVILAGVDGEEFTDVPESIRFTFKPVKTAQTE